MLILFSLSLAFQSMLNQYNIFLWCAVIDDLNSLFFQVFISQNKEAPIFFSNTSLKLFQALAESAAELLRLPPELRAWDSSLASLRRLIEAIEDDAERERHAMQFNRIMQAAGVPPTSTSMFNR